MPHDHEAWSAAIVKANACAETVRVALVERDAAIVEAVAAGVSQREVARATYLSHTTVQQIIKRLTDPYSEDADWTEL